ncbi:MAG: methylated-DNA--[protein]-cysteine S-methyltransferase [Candidatus Thermoplasmatota archaeon]|nr:methylated-DNA--[protein]-cysteine S-methyltransferase [Candidatus Thermoplasmatota archaeon]
MKKTSGRGSKKHSDQNKKSRLVEIVSTYIKENSSSNLSLKALEERFEVNKFTIQRTFMDVLGISPRKYAEECRIMHLKDRIRKGEPVTRAIYSSGYNPQNWLYRNSASKLGMTPSEYRNHGKGIRIRYMISESRLGFILVAETDRGICSVSMADSPDQLVRQLSSEFAEATLIESDQVRASMNAILRCLEGKKLNLPVDVHGTEFQRRVWAAISRIPYGETKSYNGIAEEIGMPKAYRAVANACGANPVPLIVPCHRVIRKDGSLGGYGMGIERKKYLLEMEKTVVKKSH